MEKSNPVTGNATKYSCERSIYIVPNFINHKYQAYGNIRDCDNCTKMGCMTQLIQTQFKVGQQHKISIGISTLVQFFMKHKYQIDRNEIYIHNHL